MALSRLSRDPSIIQPVALKLWPTAEPPKMQPAGSQSQNMWFRMSGAGLRTCISNRHPGDALAAGLKTLL